ncbi:MAG: hypothetical protein ACYDCK_04085 [Thermoplasmatota archaeon]
MQKRVPGYLVVIFFVVGVILITQTLWALSAQSRAQDLNRGTVEGTDLARASLRADLARVLTYYAPGGNASLARLDVKHAAADERILAAIATNPSDRKFWTVTSADFERLALDFGVNANATASFRNIATNWSVEAGNPYHPDVEQQITMQLAWDEINAFERAAGYPVQPPSAAVDYPVV